MNTVTKNDDGAEARKSSKPSGQEISSALKDRLKKCGRYHTGSPSTDVQTHPSVSFDISTPSNNSCFSKRKWTTLSKKCASEELKKRKLEYEEVLEEENAFSKSDAAKLQVLEETSQNTRLKLTDEKGKNTQAPNLSQPSSTRIENLQKLQAEKRVLESKLKERNETLRKLKMVKMYREKNNLSQLQSLINIWREVSQKTLTDLHQLLPEPRPTLTQFIASLHLDSHLLHYDVEDENFA